MIWAIHLLYFIYGNYFFSRIIYELENSQNSASNYTILSLMKKILLIINNNFLEK